MSAIGRLSRQLAAVVVIGLLTLLSGCTTWTGVPTTYRQNGRYPVIASVHGIVKFSSDASGASINYISTNVLTLSTNTGHGWFIEIPPAPKDLEVREYFVAPGATRWPKDHRISHDRTTCLTRIVARKGAKYIDSSWGMSADDPLGDYEIAVFIDRKLAADFKFRVVAE